MPKQPGDSTNPRAEPRRRNGGGDDAVLADLEAAWERWVSGIEVADARLRSLLRAAFAAGYEAGHHGGPTR